MTLCIEGAVYLWNPLKPACITAAEVKRFGEPTDSLPGWGNDVTELGDSSPDRLLCPDLADAPGVFLLCRSSLFP
jgi:hypothetical protein